METATHIATFVIGFLCGVLAIAWFQAPAWRTVREVTVDMRKRAQR